MSNTRTTLALLLGSLMSGAAVAGDDPFLWLEEVQGEKALNWVKERNGTSLEALTASPEYQKAYDNILQVLDSDKKIDYPSRRGKYLYNFWRDAEHQRGLYRRTTLASYASGKPKWEAVLDVDALAKAEGENWVFKGMSCLYPDYEHCVVNLSRGGADATVSREFNSRTKHFVEGGFTLPEAKGGFSFIDKDTVFVSTDFGEGTTTDSGYPRQVKIWHRGQPLDKAELIYETSQDAVSAGGYRAFSKHGNLDIVYDAPSFFTNRAWIRHDGKLIKVPKPDDAQFTAYFNKQLIIKLRSDWPEKGFKRGALVSLALDKALAGKDDFQPLLSPGERLSIEDVATTQDHLLVTVLDNVKSRVLRLTPGKDGWQQQDLALADNASIGVFNTDEADNDFYYTVTGFLEPTTLYRADANKVKPQQLRQSPSWFDASTMTVEQHQAKSKDGTLVPYFLVKHKDTKLNGKNPTLLYGYGGFEVSLTPYYSANTGMNWLSEGGVYVLANIRGGGEFGPAWHQAALQKHRMKAYEDFIAVAEALIANKVTSPEHLGIQGGSNGGLLVGATMVLRPDLFNAVVCQVPLLDMKRYHKLLAGASWMAEYGNPDDAAMWEVIKSYSPYQNVKQGVDYPKAFFTTSTRDDRVHPGHARKMVAKMQSQGHDVLYFENTEGGHAGAADNKQRAKVYALVYSYLWSQLK
ncbi:prolyl oligopeptidase family serine peptidase [Gallaecimonas sp. GXIMD4217]|uniref:prolyl oligopeptidase family serine peptidase n=1 Tax=Gallaecimonas sp. GXIMD4217 TaxID=3131927 RepID=UPI00311ADE29